MKFWKTWPYWVKGGIIGIVIFLIGIAIVFILGIAHFEDRVVYCLQAPCPSGFGVYTTIEQISFLTVQNFCSLLSIILSSFFIVGAVIGGLYGKIKNRKVAK